MIFLVISMLLAMMSPSVALPADKTTQEKAQLLNTLKIISGTNGEFNLSNQVRRSEAAAFIVNLLGKGAHVAANKAQYSLTTYTDVPSTQWYAPFIGFCSQNGYVINSSTEFKPLDFITEKEFLKLVMMAMEYRENTDFTSDTIYDKARELGLITLNEYINFSTEGVSKIPTRGNVVDVLYAALSLNTRTGYKMAQKLIDEKVVTRVEAMAYGLINDTKATAIVSVENTDLENVEVRMNENLVSIGDVRIYSKANPTSYLACQVSAVSGDLVQIKSSALDTGVTYIIELTNIKDTEGNLTQKLFAEFKGFEPKEIKSNFFRISKIEPINTRSIMVYFTHPVTINSEVCLYYSIYSDNTIVADGKKGQIKGGVLNSNKTAVLLSLDSGILNEGRLYTLKIDGGMPSAYGVSLNNGLGDSMKFVASQNIDAKFQLMQCSPLDKRTLHLVFNKEINPFLAQQIYNFYITDKNNSPIKINSTVLDINGCGIFINLGQDMVKGEKYYLTINNLNDITKQEYISEEIFPYNADFGTTSGFDFDGIHIVDSQTIELFFNRPLNVSTAEVLNNYSIIRSGTYIVVHPERVLYDPKTDQYKVTLFLSANNRLSSQYMYDLSASVKDYLGYSAASAKITFNGIDTPSYDTGIEEVVPVSTDTIKLTFTKQIAFASPNLLPSNYILEYDYNRNNIKKVPICVIYIDSRTLALKFDCLEDDTAYKLKVVELLDVTGSIVRGKEKVFIFEAE